LQVKLAKLELIIFVIVTQLQIFVTDD